jgi:hypothetical protein
LLVVGVNAANLLAVAFLQVADDAVMVGHHESRFFKLLELVPHLPYFLPQLLNYADQPFQRGNHLLERPCKLLLARGHLRVHRERLL